jgi:hypothetical protein
MPTAISPADTTLQTVCPTRVAKKANTTIGGVGLETSISPTSSVPETTMYCPNLILRTPDILHLQSTNHRPTTSLSYISASQQSSLRTTLLTSITHFHAIPPVMSGLQYSTMMTSKLSSPSSISLFPLTTHAITILALITTFSTIAQCLNNMPPFHLSQ